MLSSLELDTILRNSFQQFKRIWLRSLVTFLINTGVIFFTAVLGIFVFGLILFLVYNINQTAFYILLFICGVVFILLMSYVSSLTSLAYIKVTTSEDQNLGPFQALSEANSIAFGFLIYQLLSSVFLIGLVPYLFIPFIIWSIWGALAPFVYLHEPQMRHGLFPIYKSRALVKGYFWPMFFVIILLFISPLVIFSLFGYAGEIGNFVYILFNYVVLVPFQTILLSEIYKELKGIKESTQPIEVHRPVISIFFSILGLVLIILLSISLIDLVSQSVNKVPKKFKSNFKFNQVITPTIYPRESQFDFEGQL